VHAFSSFDAAFYLYVLAAIGVMLFCLLVEAYLC